MIAFVRAGGNPKYKRIVFICGSQMGKTDNTLNIIGHRCDDDPAPILYVGPTKSNVERVIEPRLIKMFRSSQSLWDKLAKGKKSSKTYKNIAGISVRLGWAGSATELASQDACIVFVDERDRMSDDVGSEGDPVEIADARHFTYSDGKTIVTSTPTVGNVDEKENKETGLTHWEQTEGEEIQSPTWKLWQEGTRHEWAWPCPKCRKYFIARFSLLWWPEGATPQQALKETRIKCPHCEYLISDNHKTEMNARGVYVAPGQSITKSGEVVGEMDENDCASFWVSGLCSPWRSWGQRATAFIRAAHSGDPGRIQATINVGFGELYKVGGDAPPWESVHDLAIDYTSGQIVTGIRAITCGVDVQKDRLVYVIRGWGVAMESWLIFHGELWGQTEHNQVWADLSQLITKPIGNSRIGLVNIDSGYRPGDKFKQPTNQIYAFSRQHRGLVRPTKGHAEQDKPIKAAMIDVTIAGKTIKNGLQLWHVDSDYFKAWVHARLEWPADQPGRWNLPSDITEDYCKQLTAEARVVKPSGKVVWVKVRKDNHYLDCEYLNVAGAHMLQMHTLVETGGQQQRQRRYRSKGVQ